MERMTKGEGMTPEEYIAMVEEENKNLKEKIEKMEYGNSLVFDDVERICNEKLQLKKEYEDLLDKYNFVLWKLSNNPEIQKQTDEMIKFYKYMTSHDRLLGPVLLFIAGMVIGIILYSIF